jgi:1-acyl-sn-glycerol-3-phosphate acyltransferase
MTTPILAPSDAVEMPRVSRPRVILNRIVFRVMLFTMGTLAVIMYPFSPRLTWRFAKAQARLLMRLCGVRVRTRGLEHLGVGPYVFAPNHASHFDIAMLLGYLPGNNRFAAKRELFRQPVFGAVLRTLGMIPVDRENPGASIEALEKIGRGDFSTIIFPEGTRSLDGRLLPFKKGAFVAAIHLGFPIVPVVCKGTQAVMPKGGYLSILPGDVELVVLPPIPTTGLTYDDRDRLLQRVRDQIAAELAPPRSHPIAGVRAPQLE